jgi:hypothetical protein
MGIEPSHVCHGKYPRMKKIAPILRRPALFLLFGRTAPQN